MTSGGPQGFDLGPVPCNYSQVICYYLEYQISLGSCYAVYADNIKILSILNKLIYKRVYKKYMIGSQK